jgi:hypothetical protein
VTTQRTSLIAAVVLALAGPAVAQEQATVLKRDGSRVSGRFEAWNRNTNTLYIRVSLGDQRIIPLNEAAVLEVAGNADNLPANETEAARGSDHVLVLRSGEVLRGRLTNIEGGEGSGQENEPRILTFKPNDGAEKRTPFADVRRLYFGNFPGSQTTASGANSTLSEPDLPSGAVRVPANGRWVATSFIVRAGDRVAFNATGEVQLSSDGAERATPAGSVRGSKSANAPMPDVLLGALIGRIGPNGQPFAIGNQTQELGMPAAGQLFLAVNDDHVDDNQGAFGVTVRIANRRTRR